MEPQTIRIGTVAYLNAVPLSFDLPVFPGARVTWGHPAQLALMLTRGELDVALAPALLHASTGYRIISGTCIASHGPALSVRLCCRCEPHNIQTIHFDPNSLSTNAMTRLLLAEQYGLRPREAQTEDQADAFVVIGDEALKRTWDEGPALDLGEAWRRWCGRPFVYAVWLARPDVNVGTLEEYLTAAPERFKPHLEHLAQVHAQRLGLSPQLCLDYWERCMHYRFDEETRAGLDFFLEALKRRGELRPHYQ